MVMCVAPVSYERARAQRRAERHDVGSGVSTSIATPRTHAPTECAAARPARARPTAHGAGATRRFAAIAMERARPARCLRTSECGKRDKRDARACDEQRKRVRRRPRLRATRATALPHPRARGAQEAPPMLRF